MPLIRENGVASDPWVLLADDAELPADGAIIVSLTRWLAEREVLRARKSPLGIKLKSDQRPELIAEDIERFDLIALEFPKFTDGRAYSSARLLRERYGYSGELRAVGQVLRDQLQFMHRCGFDAFEIAATDAADKWRQALAEISVWYQSGADTRRPASVLRHRVHRRAVQDEKDRSGREPARAPLAAIQAPSSLAADSSGCAAYWAY
ncbi:MAG: DUF934 domain-containing protein [Dongiaceae bacterium]